MVDQFLTLYIGQTGVSRVIEEVLEILDPEFLYSLARPQVERAKAAKGVLKPLDIDSADKVVYMRVSTVHCWRWLLGKLPPRVSRGCN